jgi:hypothetical protein
MPNHAHLVVETDDVPAARRLLARCLGHLQRWWARGGSVWERVRAPKVVASVSSLFKELRYVSLNPPRAGLCRDPLEWAWSTHRDVIGAVVDPWVDVDRLARALRTSATELAAKWHAYVSGDRSVAIQGTPLPVPATRTDLPTRPLHDIVCAAGAALRIPVARLGSTPRGRRLFVALARAQGWTSNARLAEALGTSIRNVQRAPPVPAPAMAAAELCLGDRRLWSAFENVAELGRRSVGPPKWK